MHTTPMAVVVRTGTRVLRWVVALLLGGLLFLLGFLLFWSYPGKPRPFLDANGRPLPDSIAEKIYLDINGVRQGMFIKGKHMHNPVLLYLHGGMPDYFLSERYPNGLEDNFTVIWWEQRGTGMSYSPDIPASTLTQEQLIADTIAVTNYARQRFGQDKIYLIGHSGGTFIGIQAAARAPELYRAYIGVAQMANQLESERLAYVYMLGQYRTLGDQAMIRRLEAAPVTDAGTPEAYLALRDEAMHALGIGTTHTMRSVADGIFLPSLQSQDYTLKEKIRLWRGKAAAGVSVLWQTVTHTDLAAQVPRVDIPVYFLHGSYDYTCAYPVAHTYFDQLQAPAKGFYTFEHCAHSPMFEDPAKFRQIMEVDVLHGSNSLADGR
jgi:pimeloyl-ACP methyl ester carboxylesterase